MLDIKESLNIAALIGAEPNACWSNAWDAIRNVPGYFAGGTYSEGWLVIETETEVFLIEHGWCGLACGQIIDPTLVYLSGIWSSAQYFVGYQLSWQQVLHMPEEVMLPVIRYSSYRDEGLEHPGYREAYVSAHQEAEQRAQRRHCPLVLYRMQARPLVTLIVEHIENERTKEEASVYEEAGQQAPG